MQSVPPISSVPAQTQIGQNLSQPKQGESVSSKNQTPQRPSHSLPPISSIDSSLLHSNDQLNRVYTTSRFPFSTLSLPSPSTSTLALREISNEGDIPRRVVERFNYNISLLPSALDQDKKDAAVAKEIVSAFILYTLHNVLTTPSYVSSTKKPLLNGFNNNNPQAVERFLETTHNLIQSTEVLTRKRFDEQVSQELRKPISRTLDAMANSVDLGAFQGILKQSLISDPSCFESPDLPTKIMEWKTKIERLITNSEQWRAHYRSAFTPSLMRTGSLTSVASLNSSFSSNQESGAIVRKSQILSRAESIHLTEEVDFLRKQLAEKQTDIEQQEIQIFDLQQSQKELDTLRKNRDETVEEKQALQREVDSLRKQLDENQGLFQELTDGNQRELADLNKKLQDNEIQKQELSNELLNKQARLEELTQEVIRAREKEAKFQDQLQEITQQKDKDSHDQGQTKLLYEAEIAKLNRTLTERTTELNRVSAEKDSLLRSIETVNERLDSLAEEKNTADTQIKHLEEEQSHLKNVLSQREEEVASLTKKLNVQITQLEGVHKKEQDEKIVQTDDVHIPQQNEKTVSDKEIQTASSSALANEMIRGLKKERLALEKEIQDLKRDKAMITQKVLEKDTSVNEYRDINKKLEREILELNQAIEKQKKGDASSEEMESDASHSMSESSSNKRTISMGTLRAKETAGFRAVSDYSETLTKKKTGN